MGTLTQTFSFTPGTPAVASQVNTDLQTLFNWVNTNGIWADASTAFTGVPTGPSLDPTSANQFTRKSFVDNKLLSGTTPVLLRGGQSSAIVNGSSQALWSFPSAWPTAAVAFIGQVIASGGGTVGGDAAMVTMSTTQVQIQFTQASGANFTNGNTVFFTWIALGY